MSPEEKDEMRRDESSAASLLIELARTHPNLLKLLIRLEEGHAREMFFLYKHPWQLLWINFLAGLSRGIGLTVGTALFLALAAYVLGKFISLPVVGEYIARLLDIVDTYRSGPLYQ